MDMLATYDLLAAFYASDTLPGRPWSMDMLGTYDLHTAFYASDTTWPPPTPQGGAGVE